MNTRVPQHSADFDRSFGAEDPYGTCGAMLTVREKVCLPTFVHMYVGWVGSVGVN